METAASFEARYAPSSHPTTYSAWLGFAGMPSDTLGQEQNAAEDEHCDNSGSNGAAERQPTIADRFVEEVADGRAKRSSQDESSPE